MENARKVPDEVRQILAEVCAEYRVRIDPDDPAVAVVMLHRLVLELALNRAVERIEAATAGLNSQVDAVQVRVGAVLAQGLRTALTSSSETTTRGYTPFAAPQITTRTLIIVAVLVFALGLLCGVLIR